MTRRGARAPEKAVQAAVKGLYVRFGCSVYDTSQPFRALITPGVPDLMVFSAKARAFWFHEVKAADGKPSEDQLVFLGRCQLAGIGHVLGGVDAAREKLAALGLIAKVG